jgi:hypothetical protein
MANFMVLLESAAKSLDTCYHQHCTQQLKKYNVVLGGMKFIFQQHWVNDKTTGGFCALSYWVDYEARTNANSEARLKNHHVRQVLLLLRVLMRVSATDCNAVPQNCVRNFAREY